jgi:hypothetical protein
MLLDTAHVPVEMFLRIYCCYGVPKLMVPPTFTFTLMKEVTHPSETFVTHPISPVEFFLSQSDIYFYLRLSENRNKYSTSN